MKKKSTFALLLVMLFLCQCVAFANAQQNYNAGVYVAQAAGNNGNISVKVAFTADAISEVRITEHNETPGICETAFDKIPAAIVAGQTLAIDVVSGATNTSNAILNAVADCVIQAGGNPDALNTVAAKELVAGEDVDVDIVIVGAGMAGIMAAHTLETEYPEVSYLLIEKLDMLTGSLPGTGGIMVSATSKAHENEGLVTTSENIADLMEYMSGTQVRRTLIDNIYSESGASMNVLIDNGLVYNTPLTLPTRYSDTVYGIRATERGAGLAKFMTELAGKYNLNIRTGTKAVELLVKDNAVVGVKAEDGQTAYEIHADYVLLTTGGFGSDETYLKELCPDYAYDEVIIATNAGATGDAITMTRQFGTKLVGYGTMGSARASDGNGLISSAFMINANGERFIDETEPVYILNSVIAETQNRTAWFLADNSYADQATLATRIADGAVQKYESLEALAEGIDVPVENLLATVEAYNTAVKNGQSPEFGVPVNKATPLQEAPFYACKLATRIFGTIAGIEVSDTCQVLDGEGNPISGLYAGGEVIAGNAFTKQYVTSGVGIGFAMANGRYLAVEAAKAVLSK